MRFLKTSLKPMSRRQLLRGALQASIAAVLSSCSESPAPAGPMESTVPPTLTAREPSQANQATAAPSAVTGTQDVVTVAPVSPTNTAPAQPQPALPLIPRIYLAPDDHTDFLWSAGETEYERAFVEMLDYYLDLADRTEQEPAAFQSRWNCDGSYWVWVYERKRSPEQFNRLINRIRDGHITVPINPLIEVYGSAPLEAVLRSMYYAGKLERKYALSFPLFVPMENQALPLGLGSLCAGSGAKYAWKGICGCVSKIDDAWDREHDIYWWVGLDGSRILMKWNSMLNGNENMGGYAEARNPAASIDFVETNPEFKRRYPYAIIGIFGKGWDDLETRTDEFSSIAKELTNDQRQVIVSNEVDFFKDFESNYGNQLPQLSCTYGNEWDLYTASMAEVSAQVKRAVEKLRGAEAIAALVSLYGSAPVQGKETERDQVYMGMGLYYEHDWTADSEIVPREDRAAFQRRLANSITEYVDGFSNVAIDMLGQLIETGNGHEFYVFNQLSWLRTDVAYFPYTGSVPFKVIDLSTGEEVSCQLVTRNGKPYIQIIAQDVPPLGYKVFEIQTGAGKDFSPAGSVSGNTFENAVYRIGVSPSGSISSLVDKTLDNREFAREINGRFINDLGEASGELTVESVGPVSVTLRVTADQPVRHVIRYTLYQDLARVDIENEINENFDEILTWAFSFNLENPDTWHEEVGAVIRCKLLDDGGHYAPRNARYDWLTLNHFVDMSSDGVGVTVSNADCSFMRLGNSEVKRLDDQTPQVNVLAGGQVDGADLGIPGQGGDRYFLQRFSLSTHAEYDPASMMHFALEHQNPLITGPVTGGKHLPGTQFSLGQLSQADILVWALKPAEDGEKGMLVRLWNMTAEEKEVDLRMNFGIGPTAYEVSHIESRRSPILVQDNQLKVTFSPNQIKSIILYAL